MLMGYAQPSLAGIGVPKVLTRNSSMCLDAQSGVKTKRQPYFWLVCTGSIPQSWAVLTADGCPSVYPHRSHQDHPIAASGHVLNAAGRRKFPKHTCLQQHPKTFSTSNFEKHRPHIMKYSAYVLSKECSCHLKVPRANRIRNNRF